MYIAVIISRVVTLDGKEERVIPPKRSKRHRQLGCEEEAADMDGDDERGLIWRLPVVKTNDLGKLGPGFAIGAGCGLGFGVGLIGGLHFFTSIFHFWFLNGLL